MHGKQPGRGGKHQASRWQKSKHCRKKVRQRRGEEEVGRRNWFLKAPRLYNPNLRGSELRLHLHKPEGSWPASHRFLLFKPRCSGAAALRLHPHEPASPWATNSGSTSTSYCALLLPSPYFSWFRISKKSSESMPRLETFFGFVF